MPWVSIISFIITFLLSKSKGASTGEAAALAAGVGLATYYIADPANPDNLLGFGGDAKDVPGNPNDDSKVSAPSNGGGTASALGGVLKTGLSEVGTTVRSWGPAGTLGVVAGTSAISKVMDAEWFPWAIGLGALFLILR